jgi:chromosome segregation ATPase
MIYLIAQTWLFLVIACLIGMLMSFFLLRNQKSERQAHLETEALEARQRAIAMEKELEDYRGRLAELEGLPAAARASRIASREEMGQRITILERELLGLKANEKKLADEAARLKEESESFRGRYLEARAKWDEYKARADALAQVAEPLDLGTATVMPDDGMRKRLLELEGALTEITREKERLGEQARQAQGRVRELERQAAGTTPADDPRAQETIRSMQQRLSELEGQLAQATGERDASAGQIQQMLARVRQLESVSARVSDAEALAASTQKERDASMAAMNLARARIAELEGRLASGFAAARETDALRSRILDLQDKLSAADVALSRSLERMRQETDPLRARIAELESRLAASASGPPPIETAVPDQSPEIEILRAKLDAAEARALRADALAAEVDALNQRLLDVPLTLDAPVADPVEVQELRVRIGELEGALERAVNRPVEPAVQEPPELLARVGELESAIERLSREAAAAEALRQDVSTLEARLSEAAAQAQRGSPEAEQLKARLAEVEERLASQAQAVADAGALRQRLNVVEAMLHEAAKSRDEAAVLRSKLAELDGRLGQTMKALAEARARNPQNEAV